MLWKPKISPEISWFFGKSKRTSRKMKDPIILPVTHSGSGQKAERISLEFG